MNETDFKKLRKSMVLNQISNRDIRDSKILEAFENVPRHQFVPDGQKSLAYQDCPLPIGKGQTISQPFIVALMTESLELRAGMKVLEVGTGSGYQAAILSYLGVQVYSIECIKSLGLVSKNLFERLGYNIEIKIGDGTCGWIENSPYDRIIVTAAAPKTPIALIDQLKAGGKLVIPVGEKYVQDLMVINKETESEINEKNICSCRFVPLVGRYGYKT